MKYWIHTLVLILVISRGSHATTVDMVGTMEPPPLAKVKAVPKSTEASAPAAAPNADPQVSEQFMSAIQFAFQESSPEMLDRSRRLVKQQFAETLDGWPDLAGRQYEVKTIGNEVVFYLTSEHDMQEPMQRAVARLVERINGKVRTRGRSQFFKTGLSQPVGGYLETVVNDNHTKIVSISAQSVTLRDLLKQLKVQLGSFSYMVPGECAERPVDWSFGGDGTIPTEAKTVETVMSEIATLFNLKFEKKNGTHIFSGECPVVKRARPAAEMMEAGLVPVTTEGFHRPSVYFPVTPIGIGN